MGAASRQNRAMLGIMLGPCYQLRRLVVALRLQQGGSCQAKVRRLISRTGSAANQQSAKRSSLSEPCQAVASTHLVPLQRRGQDGVLVRSSVSNDGPEVAQPCRFEWSQVCGDEHASGATAPVEPRGVAVATSGVVCTRLLMRVPGRSALHRTKRMRRVAHLRWPSARLWSSCRRR